MDEELLNLLRRVVYVWDMGYPVCPNSILAESVRTAAVAASGEPKPVVAPDLGGEG